MRPALALGFLVLLAGPAGAQETFPEQETIVVSASRTGTPLKDISGHATIVTSTEIARVAPRSVDELLIKTVGDADVSGSAADQTLSRHVALRGVGDPSRTLLLLDGVPLQTPRNSWVDWQLLDPGDMERVEVLRGPYSSVHGSGAMGGVINMVTKTPRRPSETSAGFSYGSFDARTLRARQAGRLGSLAYSVSGRDFRTGGFVAERQPTSASIARDRREWGLASKLSWLPSEESSLTAGYLQGGDAFNRGRPFYLEDRNDRVGYLRGETRLGEVGLRGRVFLDYFREWQTSDKKPYTSADSVRVRNMSSAGGGVEASAPAGALGALTAGLDGWSSRLSESWQYQTSTRQVGTRARQEYLAPFLDDERRWLDDRLALSVGARLDWYRSHGGYSLDTTANPKETFYPSKNFVSWNPRAGLVYHADEATKLRAAAGKGFAAPTFNNLYTVLRKPGSSVLPDPELRPEGLWSYELGADRRLLPGLSGGVTFFQSFARDLIDQHAVGADTQWINAGKVHATGVETELTWTPARAWTLGASYAFTRAKIAANETAPETVGADFTNASPNKLLLSAAFDEPRWFSAYTRLRYRDHAFASAEHFSMTRAYWVWDAGVAKTLGPFTARLDVENLGDRRYDVFDLEDVLSAPGRVFTGTVSVSF